MEGPIPSAASNGDINNNSNGSHNEEKDSASVAKENKRETSEFNDEKKRSSDEEDKEDVLNDNDLFIKIYGAREKEELRNLIQKAKDKEEFYEDRFYELLLCYKKSKGLEFSEIELVDFQVVFLFHRSSLKSGDNESNSIMNRIHFSGNVHEKVEAILQTVEFDLGKNNSMDNGLSHSHKHYHKEDILDDDELFNEIYGEKEVAELSDLSKKVEDGKQEEVDDNRLLELTLYDKKKKGLVELTEAELNDLRFFMSHRKAERLNIMLANHDDIMNIPSDGGDTIDSADDDKQIENHTFEPGDHIIRWEMLPIAWPIQIHGIVLETGEGFVKLVDFGMTAVNNEKAEQQQQQEDCEEQTKFLVKSQEAFDQAWNKIRSKDIQRLHIVTITKQKELKSWHKVNYGGNLFGFGGDENASANGQTNKKAAWWYFGKKNTLCGDADTLSDGEQVDSAMSKEEEQKGAVADDQTVNTTTTSGDPPSMESEPQDPSPKKGAFLNKFWSFRQNNPKAELDEKSETIVEDDNISSSTRSGDGSNLMQRQMNPAMAKILNTQESTSTQLSDVSEASGKRLTLAEKAKQSKAWKSTTLLTKKMVGMKPPAKKEPKEKIKNVLPKSDPAVVVLARTKFLLEHGETVLPPYHVFYSNSECISVWCKTGVWSTLQAAVFLHSCAIGNAKSSFLITTGVAAAMPLFGAALAVAGVAAVAMPWWIIKISKDRWAEATTKLTDLFWAQAEPEVFIACIEQWSKMTLGETELPKSPNTTSTSNGHTSPPTDVVIDEKHTHSINDDAIANNKEAAEAENVPVIAAL